MSPPHTTTLADLIDRARTLRRVTSFRALAEEGKERGYKISHTTLSQIHNGTYSPTPERITLEAIAFLADVSYQDAKRASGLSVAARPMHEEFGPEFDVLPPEHRAVVKSVARALLDAGRQRGVGTDRVIERPIHLEDDVAYATDEDLDGPDELTTSG